MRVQTMQERALVRAVILPLAVISLASLCGLFWQGNNRPLAWLGAIATVEPDGLLELARRHLHPERLGAVVVGPVSALESQFSGKRGTGMPAVSAKLRTSRSAPERMMP